MSDPIVLLTQDQVDRWKVEKAECEKMIAKTQVRLTEVDRKLTAASEFTSMDLSEPSPQEKAIAEPKVDMSDQEPMTPMTEAVLTVVQDAGGKTTRIKIKEALRKAGYPDNRLGNYFYTVMARHTQRGNLIRDGNWYSLAEQGEPSPQNQEASSYSRHKDLLDASNETGFAIQ